MIRGDDETVSEKLKKLPFVGIEIRSVPDDIRSTIPKSNTRPQ